LHGQYLPFRCQPEGRFDTPVYLAEAAPKAAPGELSDWKPLKTSKEGRDAVRSFFREKLKRHDFDEYIMKSLAADFACVLGGYLRAAPQQEAQEPYSIDADPQGIRAVVADAITGALAFGAQGANPPPEGHWLTPFWEMAREEAMRTQPAPAPLSDDVVRDAARWRMVALIGNEVMLHPEKRTQAAAVKAYMDATHSGLDLTGAVDAALAAQGGKA
jgi:hypothetical protein